MNYQEMDWELEAKRVERAFDVEGKCEFAISETLASLESLTNPLDITLPLANLDAGIRVHHWLKQKRGVYMAICDESICGLMFSADGSVTYHEKHETMEGKLILARALFHLDLFTPEVEATLQVSISAHEKTEWLLEYEARLKAQGVITGK